MTEFRIEVSERRQTAGGHLLLVGEEAHIGPVTVTVSPAYADSFARVVEGAEVVLGLPARTTAGALRRAIREPIHHLVGETRDGGVALYTTPHCPGRLKALSTIPFLRRG